MSTTALLLTLSLAFLVIAAHARPLSSGNTTCPLIKIDKMLRLNASASSFSSFIFGKMTFSLYSIQLLSISPPAFIIPWSLYYFLNIKTFIEKSIRIRKKYISFFLLNLISKEYKNIAKTIENFSKVENTLRGRILPFLFQSVKNGTCLTLLYACFSKPYLLVRH